MPPRAKAPATDLEAVGLVEPAQTVVGKNGFGNEPTAVLLAGDLLRWVIPKVGRFPRAVRYGLGARIESAHLDVLE